jgi:hypothetical protein
MHILEEIAETFSVLHDGSIQSFHFEAERLTLAVSCQYLARRIDPAYGKFKLRLGGVKNVSLERWMTDSSKQPLLTDLPTLVQVFQGDLSILRAEVKDGAVSIYLTQSHSEGELHCIGGTLSLSASTLVVEDEGGKRLAIEELVELARGYWNLRSAERRK